MKKIDINKENQFYVNAKPDFTHDYTGIKVGSFMLDRHGNFYPITKIETDECGRKIIISNGKKLCIQYKSPHNMLTKQPFFAYQFKTNEQ